MLAAGAAGAPAMLAAGAAEAPQPGRQLQAGQQVIPPAAAVEEDAELEQLLSQLGIGPAPAALPPVAGPPAPSQRPQPATALSVGTTQQAGAVAENEEEPDEELCCPLTLVGLAGSAHSCFAISAVKFFGADVLSPCSGAAPCCAAIL